jgi:hypothetical protein
VNCQRWMRGREAWRPAGELFVPTRHAVELLDELDAKSFVCEHHYSGTYPAARVRVGLFRAGCGAARSLAGVAVFSVPMQGHVIPKYTGLEALAGVELGRFVLLDEVEGNGETWFLRRAFALLQERRPQVRAVVSYADPLRRLDGAGRAVTPGHIGIIYQAHNARYMGRARASMLILDQAGRTIPQRALAKLRHDEKGAAYVYSRLRLAGAPPRRPLEPGPDYVARAIADGPFRTIKHPGNHTYAWPLGSTRTRTELLLHFAPAVRYPKPERGLI